MIFIYLLKFRLLGVSGRHPRRGSVQWLYSSTGRLHRSHGQRWRNLEGVTGRNDLLELNHRGTLLLDFCVSHGLSITNTMFEHSVVHKCIWYQNTLRQISMIDFVVISSDLRQYVLDTRVSTESHLWKNFSCTSGRLGTSEWAMFKASIVEAATRSCGQKATALHYELSTS